MTTTPKIHPSWLQQLGAEFEKSYMAELRSFLVAERQAGKLIYPRPNHWFEALNRTPFDQVRVVILGQDPYHGPGQAHGLCFSVPENVPQPPSLLNIFGELYDDLGLSAPAGGDLSAWADQGVLLLNATLTVEAQRAGSHQNRGWEEFTDAAVHRLNSEGSNLVFMLWGSYAQRKGARIDESRHLVLRAPHPSPLSAHRGFHGCRHFSRANAYLEAQGKAPINWQL